MNIFYVFILKNNGNMKHLLGLFEVNSAWKYCALIFFGYFLLQNKNMLKEDRYKSNQFAVFAVKRSREELRARK